MEIKEFVPPVRGTITALKRYNPVGVGIKDKNRWCRPRRAGPFGSFRTTFAEISEAAASASPGRLIPTPRSTACCAILSARASTARCFHPLAERFGPDFSLHRDHPAAGLDPHRQVLGLAHQAKPKQDERFLRFIVDQQAVPPRGAGGERGRLADFQARLHVTAGSFRQLLGPVLLRDRTDLALQRQVPVESGSPCTPERKVWSVAKRNCTASRIGSLSRCPARLRGVFGYGTGSHPAPR